MPAFLQRTHGMSSGEVGTALGLIIGLFGGIGTFFGGRWADRLGRADERWFMWLPAMAFLVALGQSLLGNYALDKTMNDVHEQGEQVGRLYRLVIRDEHEYSGFLNMDDLNLYMSLARMQPSQTNKALYTRLVNSDEGFTPPGLLFGLFYTWYLDNRFAGNIEYKMSIMRNVVSDLIPEQVKIVSRREGLVDFFREKVFCHNVII